MGFASRVIGFVSKLTLIEQRWHQPKGEYGRLPCPFGGGNAVGRPPGIKDGPMLPSSGPELQPCRPCAVVTEPARANPDPDLDLSTSPSGSFSPRVQIEPPLEKPTPPKSKGEAVFEKGDAAGLLGAGLLV